MTTRPWLAEREIDVDTAAALIHARFPDMAPVAIELLGVGWDNTAYRVNDEWVFRFPRRSIAVPLLEAEQRVLPAIAGVLPLEIPVPTRLGAPSNVFPWPFCGYRMIAGRTACGNAMSDEQRAAAAAPIGAFLAALHSLPPNVVRESGAPSDAFRRLDVSYRIPRLRARLEEVARLGLVTETRGINAIINDTPLDWTPRADTLVHGDLYGRHILVDDGGSVVGVIDWGDVHVGDPASDLAIAHGFLPPSATDAFRAAYGAIDDATWRVGRLCALQMAITLIAYGHDAGDDVLIEESRRAMRYMAGG